MSAYSGQSVGDQIIGNLLLSNILVTHGALVTKHAEVWQHRWKDRARAEAWGAVADELKRRRTEISRGIYRQLEASVKSHLNAPGLPWCFLVYLVDDKRGTRFVRTAVPDEGLSLLPYPYTREAVLNGVEAPDTPPLRAMEEPWSRFEGGGLWQAEREGIAYSPQLILGDRSHFYFDVLAGFMSVVRARIPRNLDKPALGFLVVGSLYPDAFDASDCHEFIGSLASREELLINLAAITQFSDRLDHEEQKIRLRTASMVVRWMNHDFKHFRDDLMVGANSLRRELARAQLSGISRASLSAAADAMDAVGNILPCMAELGIDELDNPLSLRHGGRALIRREELEVLLQKLCSYQKTFNRDAETSVAVDALQIPSDAIPIVVELVRNAWRYGVKDHPLEVAVRVAEVENRYCVAVRSGWHRTADIARVRDAIDATSLISRRRRAQASGGPAAHEDDDVTDYHGLSFIRQKADRRRWSLAAQEEIGAGANLGYLTVTVTLPET